MECKRKEKVKKQKRTIKVGIRVSRTRGGSSRLIDKFHLLQSAMALRNSCERISYYIGN